MVKFKGLLWEDDHPPARKPKPKRSELPRCGARTRTPTRCPACGAAARVNAPCPACGASTPEGRCKAPPVRDAKGRPVNGRCRRHGGNGRGPTSEAGKAKALACLARVNARRAEERAQRAQEAAKAREVPEAQAVASGALGAGSDAA